MKSTWWLKYWLHDSISWIVTDSLSEQSKTSDSSRLLAATVLMHLSRNARVYFVYHQTSGADWKHTKIQIVLWTYRLMCSQTFLWKYTELHAAHSGTLLLQSQWPEVFYCSPSSHFTKHSSRSRKVLTQFQQIFRYSWSFHNILFCLTRCSAVSGSHMAY